MLTLQNAVLAGVACVAQTAIAQSCSTSTVQASVPTSSALALNSYSYCGGTLKTAVFIKNIDYDKIVQLYYTNANGVTTPLNVVQLGYSSSISNTNYELWTSSTSDVNLDGIQKITNITYQATDVGQSYSQTLNLPVVASGPPASTTTNPSPYATPTGFSKDITEWLQIASGGQVPLAKALMFNNIEVTKAVPGSIVAAQSYANPDYGYTWVRDTSLTMDVVASLYAAATKPDVEKFYEQLFLRYAKARAQQQIAKNLQTGIGEPKYNLDGTVFTLPWGRPQNDGPATAAITLMEFSNAYLAKGGSKDVILDQVYNTTYNSSGAPVLKDLLFVTQNWTSSSFDIWEEEQSQHFYNRLVYHRAMLMGSKFATTLGDTASAALFKKTANAIKPTLSQFYDPIRNLILYEYGPVLHGKSSFKDAAVLLGVIHGYANDGVYSFSNPQVLATAWQLTTSFIPVYKIASVHKDPSGNVLGIPVGRYPEDIYNGVDTSEGNPWYLCTSTVAEVFYRAAIEFNAAKSIPVSNISLPFWQYFAPQVNVKAGQTYTSSSPEFPKLISSLQGWGDAFLRVFKYHTPTDGHLSEEYNRNTGFAVGAIDLTWSYAALQTAAFARAQLMGNTSYIVSLANLPTHTNTSKTSS